MAEISSLGAMLYLSRSVLIELFAATRCSISVVSNTCG